MRRLMTFAVASAAMALADSTVFAQQKKSTLDTAAELLAQGHPDQSLALVNPIVEQARQGSAKDPKAICPSAALAVLQAFIKGNVRVSVENDWCEAMLVKGYALTELKRTAEASEVLEVLVGHAPENPHYMIEYAYAVRVNGELERSLQLYKRAEYLASRLDKGADPSHWRAAALRGQGFSLAELKKWDEAVKAYQRSLKFEPNSELARHELNWIDQNRPH